MSYATYPSYKQSEIPWLDEIPVHWITMQLKRGVDGCVNGIWGGEPNKDGNDTIVLRVADFDRPKLSLKSEGYTYRNIEDKEKLSRQLKRGDLLIEKSGGGEKTLVGQVVLFDKSFEAVTSNFVAKMTPSSDNDSRYLNYVFARFYAAKINYCSIKQNTGIQNLDAGAYLSEKFGFPPFDEQTQIADFLDKETAKIDTLIDKQQQLIKLLQEKRQAVISHAVTKGLNPDVKMKDSGVEWLGEVPEHWIQSRIGWVSVYISYGFTNPMPTSDSGPFMLTANDIDYGRIRYESARKTEREAFETLLTSKSKPKSNDILITKDGTLGRIAIHDGEEVCINQSVALLRLNESLINPVFMSLVLMGSLYQDRMTYEAGGTTIKHIYISRLAKMPIFFPKMDEQSGIIEVVEEIMHKMDKLIEQAMKSIELMQERRIALISAAVTGKIDVRNAA